MRAATRCRRVMWEKSLRYCPGSGAAVRVAERCGELTRGSGNSLPPRGQNLNAAVLGQDCLGQTTPWQGVLPPDRSPDGRLPLRLVPTAPIRPGELSAPHSSASASTLFGTASPMAFAILILPALGRLLGLGLELQSHSVHAIAQARRRRSIIEHVAEVATAALAVDLCASHEQALVDAGGYRIFEGCIEARPAGAAVELGLRREQGKIAPGAQVGAGRILLVKGAAPGALRAVFAQDIELLAGELFAPLLLALGDLECVARRTLGASACGLEKGAEHGDGESGQGQPAAIHHCCLL